MFSIDNILAARPLRGLSAARGAQRRGSRRLPTYRDHPVSTATPVARLGLWRLLPAPRRLRRRPPGRGRWLAPGQQLLLRAAARAGGPVGLACCGPCRWAPSSAPASRRPQVGSRLRWPRPRWPSAPPWRAPDGQAAFSFFTYHRLFSWQTCPQAPSLGGSGAGGCTLCWALRAES